MAPEVMDPGPDMDIENDAYPVTKASDVYSFTMTTLEVRSPTGNPSPNRLLRYHAT
jgi:hypothetical protein